ncbi:hypothetical protein [Paenibacillus alkalitolerans]|uniref:hypothetical protein n=1 Tax=Paenibacillus alkalitolerans TaxID=2799335 RepID=UPI0018F6E4A1|nr:hypothetical protein [Paenibacillus alkalitolerans]
MSFAAYLSLNLMVAILFAVVPKRLHMFEMIFLWISMTFFYQSFFAALTINLGWITYTMNPTDYLALVVNRLIFIPLFIIWLADLCKRARSYILKSVYTVIAVLTLSFMQYVTVWTGLIKHVHWQIWMTIVSWLALIILVMAFHKGFQRVLKRELELD